MKIKSQVKVGRGSRSGNKSGSSDRRSDGGYSGRG
jgi:hypothetical protein